MLPQYKKEAELRLKVAAGHLEGVRRMVDQEAYCVDLMKQLSAVQGTLQRVQQIFLRNHLSTCVSDAIKSGMGDAIIDELMSALKYDTTLVDGRGGFAPEATSTCEPQATFASESVANAAAGSASGSAADSLVDPAARSAAEGGPGRSARPAPERG